MSAITTRLAIKTSASASAQSSQSKRPKIGRISVAIVASSDDAALAAALQEFR